MAELTQTRAVIESGEVFDGKIIPNNKGEISRPVRIRKDATVDGSVYGETVTVDHSTIDGSAMASEAIEIDGGTVTGEVGSPGKVTGNNCTIYGTVTGTRVRLTDSVVYGNIVGEKVILENTLVIGTVSTDYELSLRDSLCYTFTAEGEITVDGGLIVLPQAKVDGQLNLQTPLKVTGLGELDTVESEVPSLDESDIVEIDGVTTLTLAPRVLNLEKVTDRLEKLESKIRDIVTTDDHEEVPPASDLLKELGVSYEFIPS